MPLLSNKLLLPLKIKSAFPFSIPIFTIPPSIMKVPEFVNRKLSLKLIIPPLSFK